MKRLRIQKLWLLAVPGALLLALAAYAIYVFSTWYRVEDKLPLTVENNAAGVAEVGREYTIVTYNIGFGAYTPDFSFFMDGGKSSRAASREAAETNARGAGETAAALGPDFALFQEVDADSDRSHHVDQRAILAETLPGMGRVWGQNYDSPYLFWPPLEPHGASLSGIMTFSSVAVDSALRRSLPVEEGLSRLVDLDRCYTVSRIPVENGKTLCLYNAHLSAYTTDGAIAEDQLAMLLADMQAEVDAGNYAVCGGDFNKDLLGDSAAVFGVAGEGANWAQPFPEDLLPEGVRLAAPSPDAPTLRDTGAPYELGKTFVMTADGFLVSRNVEVGEVQVEPTGFAWSDHDPVRMTFSLH